MFQIADIPFYVLRAHFVFIFEARLQNNVLPLNKQITKKTGVNRLWQMNPIKFELMFYANFLFRIPNFNLRRRSMKIIYYFIKEPIEM